MTRGDILHQGRLLARANDFADPDTEDFFLRDNANTLSQQLSDEYLTWKADVASGQSLYHLPSAYYLESAEAKWTTDPDEYPTPLTIAFTGQMERIASWRVDGGVPLGTTAPEGQSPQTLVVESMSSFSLYPTPIASITEGLTLRGYGYLDDSMWRTNSHECPLSARVHDALCWMQAESLAAHRGDDAIEARCHRRAMTLRSEIEVGRHTYFESARQRYAHLGVVPSRGNAGGLAAMNPLNL